MDKITLWMGVIIILAFLYKIADTKKTAKINWSALPPEEKGVKQ